MQVLPPGNSGGPSRLFILRPVATTLLMVAILLAGIIGYRFLPIAALPEVDYPTIQVVTLYPGASPDVMTSAVTAAPRRLTTQHLTWRALIPGAVLVLVAWVLVAMPTDHTSAADFLRALLSKFTMTPGCAPSANVRSFFSAALTSAA